MRTRDILNNSLTGIRLASGMYLMETLIACIVGSIIMLGIYGMAAATYRCGAASQNQILATNMAQQLIDNARNLTFGQLLAILNGNLVFSETVSLYTNPTAASGLYDRALLRQPNLIYSTAASNQRFNGTITQSLVNLTPAATAGRMIELDVNVRWTDSTGPHTYETKTVISETGIHN